jgi:hypothetical protein
MQSVRRRMSISALYFLLLAPVFAQTPEGWKVVKDSKGVCQISVPPDWTALDPSTGAATFQDTATAIAAVTSQPDQKFQPLTEYLLKLMGITKDRLFENSAKRVFYQDKVSANADDGNSFGGAVPGRTGTCSCRVTVLPSVSGETARKIALSLEPVPQS